MKQINYDKIRKERRFKVLYVEEEEILNLITTENEKSLPYQRIRKLKLPKDYYIINVFNSSERKAFGFLIGSESFPSTELGAYPLDLDNEIEIKTIELTENKDFKVIS